MEQKAYAGIAKSRYVNDKQITDHYAIIPTGQGLNALGNLSVTSQRVYEVIVRRFLCIFYPPAEYLKIGVTAKRDTETFFANFKILVKQGYLELATASFAKKNMSTNASVSKNSENSMETVTFDENLITSIQNLKKGRALPVEEFFIKEGETSPPKRYNSGSIILAMENAGQLIEEEELRAQIKGSGIGTSATRGEILKKLFNNKYLALNKKTQIVTPTMLGEMIYDVVDHSIRPLLNPELTASWEKGLTYVADGDITSDEYMKKLDDFVSRRTLAVKGLNNQYQMRACYDKAAQFYKKPVRKTGKTKK